MLLLTPVLGWVTCTGGLPFCCWTAKQCPMTMHMTGATAAGMPGCHMVHVCPTAQAPPPLVLPSPAVPVFLTATPRLAAPAPAFRPATLPTPARVYRGWPVSVFHPPQV